ncbi:MAG: acyltransferase, partial [Candidatus Limisoma sp.]|nr:acyltransferase [Candidatus Limisoma sp.]
MNENQTPEEYRDICPFTDDEFAGKMAKMVEEPGFKHAILWVMPDVDYDAFCAQLLAIRGKEEFQNKVMRPFLEMLSAKTTKGISAGGIDNISYSQAYTMITNHRDIVLDA